ncbi:MAG: glycosyltransferase family 9 protein [Armatimonadetes bacterium]|nr:glycosyltransferase family 9 protein [Armatimonadota bacterium]
MSRAYVFSVTRLGDLVESTLVLDFLHAQHRDGVVLVTSPAGRPLMEGDSRLAEVAVVSSSHPLLWRAQVARLLARVHRENAHLVNLEMYPPRWRFLRSLGRFCPHRPRCIDLEALRGEFPIATENGDPASITHRSRFYARAAGMDDVDPPSPRLHVSQDGRDRALRRLREVGLEPSRTVFVHAGCSPGWKEKRGDPVFYGRLLRALHERHGLSPVLIGTADDADAAAAIVDGGAPVLDWTGQVASRDLAATLGSAALFVGNDSGPLKIAEAVGTATISLWSDTWPEQAAPRGPRHRAARFALAPHRCAGATCEVPAHREPLPSPEEVAALSMSLPGSIQGESPSAPPGPPMAAAP